MSSIVLRLLGRRSLLLTWFYASLGTLWRAYPSCPALLFNSQLVSPVRRLEFTAVPFLTVPRPTDSAESAMHYDLHILESRLLRIIGDMQVRHGILRLRGLRLRDHAICPYRACFDRR